MTPDPADSPETVSLAAGSPKPLRSCSFSAVLVVRPATNPHPSLQVLADGLATGLADDLEAWEQYAPASHGRKQVTFSRGLRRRYRLAEEETDEEIAGRDLGSDDLIALPAGTWSAIRECAEELLTAAEVNGLLGAQVWLTKRGLASISVPTVSGLHSGSLPVAATRFR